MNDEAEDLKAMVEATVDKMVASGKFIRINIGGKPALRKVYRPPHELECKCMSDGSFICEEHRE